MTTTNEQFLKSNGVAFLRSSSTLHSYIDSQWTNIGAIAEGYDSAFVDSTGRLIVEYDSSFDFVENALTPIIVVQANDSAGDPITYSVNTVSKVFNNQNLIAEIVPSGSSYVARPNKIEEDLPHEQIIRVETTNSSMPDLGWDSYDSNYISSNGITSLTADISYSYYKASIVDTNLVKMAKLITIGIPFVEFVKTSNVSVGDVEGIHFKEDGSKIYSLSNSANNSKIEQYDLTTPFDISTLDDTTKKSIETYQGFGSSNKDLILNRDGTKLHLASSSGSNIREYDLDVPFDISSLRHRSSTFTHPEINKEIEFNDSGTRWFSLQDNSVLKGWKIADSDRFNISNTPRGTGYLHSNNSSKNLQSVTNTFEFSGYPSALEQSKGAVFFRRVYFFQGGYYFAYLHSYTHTSEVVSFTFSQDGSILFEITGVAGDDGTITQNTLSTKFDIESTTSLNKTRKHNIGFVTGFDHVRTDITNGVQKIRWTPDGTKLLVLDTFSHKIYEYTASTPYDILTIGTSSTTTIQPISSTIYPEGGFTNELSLSPIPNTASGLNLGSPNTKTNVSGVNYFDFNNNGTKLFINNHSEIYEFNLSSAYDISSATHSTTHTQFGPRMQFGCSVLIEDSANSTMFITKDNVIQQLRIPDSGIGVAADAFDSAEFSNNLISSATSLYFNDSGRTLYVGENSNNNVNEFVLTTPYKLNTISYNKTYDTPSLITDLQGIVTNSSENKMYITSSTNIYEIELNDSNFDSSTYNSVVYTATGTNTNVKGIRWNETGSQFTLGGDNRLETYKTKNNFSVLPL